MNDTSISLNKFISDTGYCSRREADNLITQGRVLLNDQPAQLGNRYQPGDTVEVDGSIISTISEKKKKEKLIYIAFNKPKGITTTTEEKIPGNIISFINHPKRIFPIGRLDKDSEGLILLTNDGDIVNKILRVSLPIDGHFIQRMASGVRIKDGMTKPCIVKRLSTHNFKIILTQGLNRQIRRMCEALGNKVQTLERIRIMNIKIDCIAVGKWRNLSDVELKQMMEMIGNSSNN